MERGRREGQTDDETRRWVGVNGVNDGEGELSLREILSKALILGVLSDRRARIEGGESERKVSRDASREERKTREERT